jgi:hypothetical protein
MNLGLAAKLSIAALILIILVGPIGSKLSINLFIYESGPIEEKIEDVLFM